MAHITFAVVGDNTIDRYVGYDEQDFVGGNAVNVAAQLALAGESVRYYGAVADDADGDFVRSRLVSVGVDVGGLVVLPGVTAVTRIRVEPDGERVFEHEDFGVTADYAPSTEHLAEIADASWVQIGMLPHAARLRALLAGSRIGQDCAVADGFSHLEVAFGSVGAETDPLPFARQAIEAGASLAVVTRGSAGAVAYTEAEAPLEIAAAPTDVVDTTGAGDSFVAGFIRARVAGVSLAESLTAAATTAAATCRHRAGFPQESRTS